MERRTGFLIAAAITAFLCGLPGLFGMCLGLMFMVIGQIPGAEIDVFNRSDPRAATAFGLGVLCFSIVAILVPVILAYIAYRSRPASIVPAPPTDEPLPPPI